MFHNNAQAGDRAAQRVKDSIDKDSFAIKDVDVCGRDFAVYAKGAANLGHALQNWAHIVKVAYT